MLRNRNRRPTSLVFVLLPLLFAPTLLLAQTGTVTGRVSAGRLGAARRPARLARQP